MFCRNCGAQLYEGSMFCVQCGANWTASVNTADISIDRTEARKKLYLVGKKYQFMTYSLIPLKGNVSTYQKVEFGQDALMAGFFKQRIPYSTVQHITAETKRILGMNLVMALLRLLVFGILFCISLMGDSGSGMLIFAILMICALLGVFCKVQIIEIHTTNQKKYKILTQKNDASVAKFIEDMKIMVGHQI